MPKASKRKTTTKEITPHQTLKPTFGRKLFLGLLAFMAFLSTLILFYQKRRGYSISDNSNETRFSNGKIRISDNLARAIPINNQIELVDSFSQILQQLHDENHIDIKLFMKSTTHHILLEKGSVEIVPHTLYNPSKQRIVFGILTDKPDVSLSMTGYEYLISPFPASKRRMLDHEIHHLANAIVSSDKHCMENSEIEQNKARTMGFIQYGLTTGPKQLETIAKINKEESMILIEKLGSLSTKRDKNILETDEKTLLDKITAYLSDYEPAYYSDVIELNTEKENELYLEILDGIRTNKPLAIYKPQDTMPLYIFAVSRYGNRCIISGYLIENPNDKVAAIVAETKRAHRDVNVNKYELFYGKEIAQRTHLAELDTLAFEQGEKVTSLFYPRLREVHRSNREQSRCGLARGIDHEQKDISDNEMAELYQDLLKVRSP